MRRRRRNAIVAKRLCDANSAVKELLDNGSTLIVLGPGGVGKTTVAAALGVAAASRHLETGVITVDPARRLRDALGLARLSARPARLDSRRLREAGMDPALKLWAMVLDVKRTWDGLVERFVKTPAARQQILANSFYQNLSERFAGAEAYAALEQLFDLHEAARFQVEIVDTPPASHTFEFIQAPANLIRLLDSRAARWLFTPYAGSNSSVLTLASRAARFVVTELERFAGIRTLSAISEFFTAAAEAINGITQRLHRTDALMHSPHVDFILVTTAEEDRLEQAAELLEQMEGEGLRLGAIVLNRLLGEAAFKAFKTHPHRVPAHLEEIATLRSRLAPEHDSKLGELVDYLEDHASQQRAAIMRAAQFARRLPRRVRILVLPEVDSGVRELRTLAGLGAILAGGDGRALLEAASAAFCAGTRSYSPGHLNDAKRRRLKAARPGRSH